jgi:hypothetical protein
MKGITMICRTAILVVLGAAVFPARFMQAEARKTAQPRQTSSSSRQVYDPIGGSNWQKKIERQNRATEREFFRRLEEERRQVHKATEKRLEQSEKQAAQRQLQQQQRNRERTRDFLGAPGTLR